MRKRLGLDWFLFSSHVGKRRASLTRDNALLRSLLGVVCIHKPEIAEQNKDGGGEKAQQWGWISAGLRGNKRRGEMRNWEETEKFQGMRVISKSFVFLGLRNEKGMASRRPG